MLGSVGPLPALKVKDTMKEDEEASRRYQIPILVCEITVMEDKTIEEKVDKKEQEPFTDHEETSRGAEHTEQKKREYQ